MRMLVVEDDPKLGPLMVGNLKRHDFAVDLANTLEDARAYLDTTTYALVLLDLGLPDGDGLSLLKSMRGKGPPTIVLTGADAVAERIRGLDAGADDYVGKPVVHDELMARVRAVLRRPGSSGTSLQMGDLEFSMADRTVTLGGGVLNLPRRELAILESLMRSSGRIVTREALEEAIYDYGEEPSSNATEANMSRLRKRLKEGGSTVEIQVVRGLGYMIMDREDA